MIPKNTMYSFLEWRALAEAGAFAISFPQLVSSTPDGDGRPVIVMPGFMCGPESTYILRITLEHKGYTVYDWGLGRNLGPNSTLDKSMVDLIHRVCGVHGEKVSLVGHSLGGLYSRIMANRFPDEVRQVITMGSPFCLKQDISEIKAIFKKVIGNTVIDIHPSDIEQMRETPQMPSTSIYTKTDGVVCWQACVDKSATECLEVSGSHCGLPHNRSAIKHILERLPTP